MTEIPNNTSGAHALEDTVWIAPDDIRYVRAVGRIRVKERELLPARRLRGFAESPNLETAIGELEDTVYGPALAALPHPEDFEDALCEELERTYALFAELSLEPDVERWLRLRHDAANLKAFLKGGTALSMSPVSAVPHDLLREAIESGDYRELPSFLARMAESASEIVRDEGLLAAELWLDREVYAAQAALLAGRRNPFLAELTRIRADLANLAAVIRIGRLGRGRTEVPLYLAAGGSFDQGFWLKLSGMPLEEIQESFFVTAYHTLVVQALDHVSQTGSFTLLEKLTEECFMLRLREAKAFVFGVEPLVAFVLAKEHEIAMVRMILVGQQNGIPGQLLVERISECYV